MAQFDAPLPHATREGNKCWGGFSDAAQADISAFHRKRTCLGDSSDIPNLMAAIDRCGHAADPHAINLRRGGAMVGGTSTRSPLRFGRLRTLLIYLSEVCASPAGVVWLLSSRRRRKATGHTRRTASTSGEELRSRPIGRGASERRYAAPRDRSTFFRRVGASSCTSRQ